MSTSKNLNATASAIWNLLEIPLEREELIARLLERFEVEEADGRLHPESFLSQELDAGMLIEAAAAR